MLYIEKEGEDSFNRVDMEPEADIRYALGRLDG
jgi:hypothetical protein